MGALRSDGGRRREVENREIRVSVGRGGSVAVGGMRVEVGLWMRVCRWARGREGRKVRMGTGIADRLVEKIGAGVG